MNNAARTIVVAVIAVLASTLTVVGSTAGANAASLSQIRAMSSDTFEQQVQYYVNQERARRGMRKVTFHACTDYYAERWSQHLASTSRFYHQSLTPFFSKCGARYAGETLARGTVTPRRVVTMWLNSAPHRRVMLSTKPNRIGLGAVLDSRGNWIVTANFTRV
jgi:uncharacterized protein YkwD